MKREKIRKSSDIARRKIGRKEKKSGNPLTLQEEK
jgi:hypothetical protein